VLGILKAYTTRVGAGPFPTELLDETGDYIQTRGAEFGATTGRRRRCGWLDLVVAKDSARLNGLSSLGITKLDVLTGLRTLKICVAYELDGKEVHTMPASLAGLSRCTPVYEELPGWQEDISAARTLEQLPPRTRSYLKRIEELTEVPLSIVSVGPGREQTIVLADPFRP
jgi:adenylosuccinate synthase